MFLSTKRPSFKNLITKLMKTFRLIGIAILKYGSDNNILNSLRYLRVLIYTFKAKSEFGLGTLKAKASYPLIMQIAGISKNSISENYDLMLYNGLVIDP